MNASAILKPTVPSVGFSAPRRTQLFSSRFDVRIRNIVGSSLGDERSTVVRRIARLQFANSIKAEYPAIWITSKQFCEELLRHFSIRTAKGFSIVDTGSKGR